MKTVLFVLLGLGIGIGIGYVIVLSPLYFSKSTATITSPVSGVTTPEKQVIGFLPYWLLGKTQDDYSSYITQLAYFSLSVDTDGHLKKLNSPIEEEPGWYMLHSGKMDDIFATARKKNVELSLTIFSGDNDTIDELMSDPITHAEALTSDVLPLMKEYSFTNLNLDIEKTKEASVSARDAFVTFTRTLKDGLQKNHAGTLTVDVSPSDLIKPDLIDVVKVSKIADSIMIMGYDYHFAGSYVTGPVAPLYGAGIDSEYDTNAAVSKALKTIPSKKVILGIPDYGYEWETIGEAPRSAVIPGTGLTASSKRVESILSSCTICTNKTDLEAEESYVTFQDPDTKTYHQIFYPTKDSTEAKVDFATQNKLGGIGIWALGYEGKDILSPLTQYKNQ